MTDRYQVRDHRVSDDVLARFPNVPSLTFYVYDTVDRIKVPFSNSGRKATAQRTADRLNAREGR